MPDFTSKLKIVRILRSALIFLMVALVPCILLAALLVRQHLIWVIGVFAVGLLLVRIAFHIFPCPQCGKPFFRAGSFAGPNMFAKRCVHCGLGDAEEETPSITGANKDE
jgi:hypothetical protein